MIKDYSLLVKTILDYYRSQSVIHKKEGAVVLFDGTLMSVVNLLLLKQTSLKLRAVVCIFNQNKYYLTYLANLGKQLNIEFEIKDLSKDLDTLSLYKNAEDNLNLEIAIRHRLTDLILNIEADKDNLFVVSNLSYSQWCLNFPHANYQNLDQLHLLNRLYYSEVQQLAAQLNVSEIVIEREPSHYLYKGQTDHKSLGFSYKDLEDYLRLHKQPVSVEETAIRDRLAPDNRNRFLCPVIARPSNILG